MRIHSSSASFSPLQRDARAPAPALISRRRHAAAGPRRRRQRVRLLSLALSGALATFTPGEGLTQNFTISSDTISSSGFQWSGGNLLVTNGVTVAGTDVSSAAVQAIPGTFGTLLNDGGTLVGGDSGLLNVVGNDIGMIDNRGLISGGNHGLYNQARIGVLSNSGNIAGAYAGISNLGEIGRIDNTGQISGSGFGIKSSGTIGTLNNSGRIDGNIGIQIEAGSVGVLDNSGVIQGNPLALAVLSGASLQSLRNSGTIAGNIYYLPSTTFSISGGSGNLFGTLTGIGGGTGTSDIGLIAAAGDVEFVSGNLLLNDHVNVGNARVINTAANLQINQQLTITGDYEQSASGTLIIGVADGAQANGNSSDSGYGQLIVNGSATLAAGSAVTLSRLNSYAFAAGQRFVVILADQGDYHEDALQYAADGFNGSITGASLSANGKDVLVLSLSNGSGGSGGNGGGNGSGSNIAADNRHARTVLEALYRYAGIDGNMLSVYNPALAFDSTASANHGGVQLTPVAVTAASARAARASFLGVFKAAADHIDQGRAARAGLSGVASGEAPRDAAIWSKAFGGRIVQSEHDEAAGYHGSFRGLMLGADLALNQDWRAGGLLSSATTKVANDGSNAGSSVRVQAYGVTGYAAYDRQSWYLNLMAGAAYQRFRTTRAVSFAGFSDQLSGSFDGLQYLMSAQAGVPLALGISARITPLFSLSYGKLHQNGYRESGGAAALAIRAAASSSLKSDLGMRFEQTHQTALGTLTPAMQLGWRHEFHTSRLTSDAAFIADASEATSFSTTGLAPIRDTAVLALGLTLVHQRQLTIAASYSIESGHGFTGQSGDIRLRWQY